MKYQSIFKITYKKAEEFVAVLFVIFTGFFTISLFKISNFFTFFSLDEMLWHSRSAIFWDKILNFDFSGLIQSAQPGITVYWFTGFMMKFIDGFDSGMIWRMIEEQEALGNDFNFINQNDAALYQANLAISHAFNTPLILWLVVFYILFYYLLKKLGFSRIIAFFSLFFISTNLYLVYWTTPSDKMLNIFLTLSLLTFLVFLTKKGGKKYFWASAILGALAVLSKLTALFIIPFYVSLFLLYPGKRINKHLIIDMFKQFSLWLVAFFITYTIFLPTVIYYPYEIYSMIFNPPGPVYETSYDPLSYIKRFSEFLSLFMKNVFLGNLNTAGSLFLMTFIIVYFGDKFRNLFANFPDKTLKIIGSYILLFVLMVTVLSNNHDTRFMSPAFAMLSLFSAIGLYFVVEIISEKAKLPSEGLYIFTFCVLILTNIFSIVTSSKLFDAFVNESFSFDILHL